MIYHKLRADSACIVSRRLCEMLAPLGLMRRGQRALSQNDGSGVALSFHVAGGLAGRGVVAMGGAVQMGLYMVNDTAVNGIGDVHKACTGCAPGVHRARACAPLTPPLFTLMAKASLLHRS